MTAGKDHFWQEMFSAGTMLVPSFYIAYMRALGTAEPTPTRLHFVAGATYGQCFASCMYHLQCALNAGEKGFNHLSSPWRTADFAMIHVCLLAYTHAVSGNMWFDLAALVLNVGCAALLVVRCLSSRPGSKADSLGAMGGIALYLGAMLWRGDVWNCCGVAFSYAVGGLFWHKNQALGKWGHGIFHLALVPCTYFVLQSSADLTAT